ncbi:Enoyl-[acyl-carrier-protein] reductase, mitochondrial [Schizosaccharomyces pombe]|uniref:Enoyl-[acyl-carrier-protein] reductase, mitochondrial n=1 Tax=Schizosaccharomyces pombe (strain 972 / ATCC 24843) TaxID=284812 RepID=ETR1_SCHPO|nr:putative enoyl-acyl-carrier-protein reductase etr1 [Schizosaccharomyces pombe]Q10488.1 RecName: Full=Enoyl-[acyl-carrier-protein] reductase, mitochondrial; AltName: Full=2-enoyl thioester reductase; Flags: Precursor [Schizosaccharomyces pombe 972h-]CAA97361.1 enoyl-[acyl-carrier protein] reductase (predicted) [Schizosaccharomyces pombe]|eukprot:NP_594891.1 putative enoyl-acyl-carrier-protein reductase etr1 [Schizosaccharomyces pombe]
MSFFKTAVRRFSSTSITRGMAKAIAYSEYGNPKEVLRAVSYNVPKCSKNQVNVRFLASPINPSDINQIQGVYPSKPPFTNDVCSSKPSAVAGNEGLVEVVDVGDQFKGTFSPGQWAILGSVNLGSWRTEMNIDGRSLVPVDKSAFPSIAEAATLSVNPCTAYCLLQHVVQLNKGDWFIQDGANSMVGIATIQLAKHFGYKSINVVRNRPDIEKLKEQLKSLGATIVITDEELMDRKTMKQKVPEWIQGGEVKLGIDCVSGRVAAEMAKYMSKGATMATFGGMSRQPLPVPVSLLIFKNLKFHGFWVTKWKSEHPEEFLKIIHKVEDFYRNGTLKTVNTELVSLKEDADEKTFLDTFLNAIEGHGKKIIKFEH